MSYQPKNLVEFEELRMFFKYAKGISTCSECGARIITNELCGLSEHMSENHQTIFAAMQSLQKKAVSRLRMARVFKRKLDELEPSEEPSKRRASKRKQDGTESSEGPSKRQRCSTFASAKPRQASSHSRVERSTRNNNQATEVRRRRPIGIDKVPEIVKSQHFFMLMSQFYCLDDCRCDCVFGRSVKIHLLHRQVLDKRSELARAEDKLREAESNMF